MNNYQWLVAFMVLLNCQTKLMAQADTTLRVGNRYKPHTISDLIFPPHKQHEPPPPDYTIRKNTIVVQAGGDTPYVGIRYNRRVYVPKSDKFLVEAGVGAGFAPRLFSSREVFPFSFDHYTALVFSGQKRTRLVSPVLGYSGLWYSVDYYREKELNYIPAPYLGLRLGNSNRFAINIGWQMYYIGRTSYNQVADNQLQVIDKKYVLGLPVISLQSSFRFKKHEK